MTSAVSIEGSAIKCKISSFANRSNTSLAIVRKSWRSFLVVHTGNALMDLLWYLQGKFSHYQPADQSEGLWLWSIHIW